MKGFDISFQPIILPQRRPPQTKIKHGFSASVYKVDEFYSEKRLER